MMKLLTLIAVLFMTSSITFGAQAEDRGDQATLILDAAEKFFLSLKNGDHASAWNSLTDKSRRTIISDVYAVSGKINPMLREEDVAEDFQNNGTMFSNYWNAFVRNFNSDMILEDCLWEMGLVQDDKAGIKLRYGRSGLITELKMFRSQGEWKVGLVETFWARKKMDFIQSFFEVIR